MLPYRRLLELKDEAKHCGAMIVPSTEVLALIKMIEDLRDNQDEFMRREIIHEKALKEIADNYCPPWHRVDGHIIAREALLAAEPDVEEQFEYYSCQNKTGPKTEPVSGLD